MRKITGECRYNGKCAYRSEHQHDARATSSNELLSSPLAGDDSDHERSIRGALSSPGERINTETLDTLLVIFANLHFKLGMWAGCDTEEFMEMNQKAKITESKIKEMYALALSSERAG